jgi:hypothetical protein
MKTRMEDGGWKIEKRGNVAARREWMKSGCGAGKGQNGSLQYWANPFPIQSGFGMCAMVIDRRYRNAASAISATVIDRRYRDAASAG